MALLLIPFFMPLMLIGWIFPPEHERELEEREAEQDRAYAATWALLYGRESEVIALHSAE